ncbi:unnamed protein product [Polarella glacialis]|uniref:Uncharacterized protein n=1 Tax=Polarella glacialis TaxID=89957 RepID=A0A813G7J6_POLGL|nr:unnamed protein product [Polarella glacialis]
MRGLLCSRCGWLQPLLLTLLLLLLLLLSLLFMGRLMDIIKMVAVLLLSLLLMLLVAGCMGLELEAGLFQQACIQKSLVQARRQWLQKLLSTVPVPVWAKENYISLKEPSLTITIPELPSLGFQRFLPRMSS